jgi:hypothetical protein
MSGDVLVVGFDRLSVFLPPGLTLLGGFPVVEDMAGCCFVALHMPIIR